jgi:hypothetical protein
LHPTDSFQEKEGNNKKRKGYVFHHLFFFLLPTFYTIFCFALSRAQRRPYGQQAMNRIRCVGIQDKTKLVIHMNEQMNEHKERIATLREDIINGEKQVPPVRKINENKHQTSLQTIFTVDFVILPLIRRFFSIGNKVSNMHKNKDN